MGSECGHEGIDRRQFLGAALLGAGIAGVGVMAGCSTGTAGAASTSSSASASAENASSSASANAASASASSAADGPLSLTADVKDATDATRNANEAAYGLLDYGDMSEYANATKNLIAAPDALEIKSEDGAVVWSQKACAFVENADAPASANPNLWENTRNNHEYGLFKVVEGIYQVRGYGMGNLTLVQGDTGWIALDALTSAECSKAALELANKELGEKPVKAIVIGQSRVDHYGGIRGIIEAEDVARVGTHVEEQVNSGKIPIIAPLGFTEAVVRERLYAGPALGRRAVYQYGSRLPKGSQGSLAMGIGNGLSAGAASFIAPSYEVPKTGTRLTVDGVEMEFQLAPGTEASAEMNVWFPKSKALWMSESCTDALRSLEAQDGFQARDGNARASYISEAIALYGDKVEVVFQAHNWPHWGNEDVNEYLLDTAAICKFVNDQTLAYLNEGYTSAEIVRMVQLPPALSGRWYTRDFCGTVQEGCKATYQRFMGWYDANPVHLAELPPADFAKKLVGYLGDSAVILGKAREDYEAGEYQWVAQITNALVFADPSNAEARQLCADALEQLGYQAESGAWRNCYLTGALELREGNQTGGASATVQIADVRESMSLEMLWDYLGIKIDKQAMADEDIKVNVRVEAGDEYGEGDTGEEAGEEYLLRIYHGPLLRFAGMQAKDADVTLSGSKKDLMLLMDGDAGKLKDAVQVEGDAGVLDKFMGAIGASGGPGMFNIVEP